MSNTLTLTVTGMSCGGCSAKVKKALEALEGVSATEIQLEGGLVTVHYSGNPAQPAAQQFRDTVTTLGFEVQD